MALPETFMKRWALPGCAQFFFGHDYLVWPSFATAGRMAQLNNEDRLVKIVQRCPAYVKSRWQTRVQDIRTRERDPNIEDLRKLIRLAAREKTDPVFGGIMEAGNKDFSARQRIPRRLEAPKGRVFSINTTEQASKSHGIS